MQISQAIYRTPKTPLAAARRARPPVDEVERAIIEIATENPTDGYRTVTAWARRALGRPVDRKRVLHVMRERKLIQRHVRQPRRRRPGFFRAQRPGQLVHLETAPTCSPTCSVTFACVSAGSIHEVRCDALNYAWDNAIAPVLEIESGEAVELHVRDASDEQIHPDSDATDVAAIDFSHVNPISGPVFVRGAQPGDVLAVEILGLRPGRTSCRPAATRSAQRSGTSAIVEDSTATRPTPSRASPATCASTNSSTPPTGSSARSCPTTSSRPPTTDGHVQSGSEQRAPLSRKAKLSTRARAADRAASKLPATPGSR